MNVLDHFSIPYLGLKNGVHRFRFDIDQSFFDAYENEYIEKGKLIGDLEIEKHSDFATATLAMNGSVQVACDRCLGDLEVPLEIDCNLHIKTGSSEEELEDVIFITPEESHINFAKYVYDMICVSIPYANVHEDEKDCDPIVIAKLNQNITKVESSGIWGPLAGLMLSEEE